MPAFDAFIRMAQQQHSTTNDNQDDNADNIRFFIKQKKPKLY